MGNEWVKHVGQDANILTEQSLSSRAAAIYKRKRWCGLQTVFMPSAARDGDLQLIVPGRAPMADSRIRCLDQGSVIGTLFEAATKQYSIFVISNLASSSEKPAVVVA